MGRISAPPQVGSEPKEAVACVFDIDSLEILEGTKAT